jgi:hypothetical protein
MQIKFASTARSRVVLLMLCQMQGLTTLITFVFWASFISLAALVGLQYTQSSNRTSYLVLNRHYHLAQVILAAFMLWCLLEASFEFISRLCYSSVPSEDTVRRSAVQRVLATLNFPHRLQVRGGWQQEVLWSSIVLTVLMLVILVSDLATNVTILVSPRHFCSIPVALCVAACLRWICWNTMLLIMVNQCPTLSIAPPPESTSKKVKKEWALACTQAFGTLHWWWRWPQCLVYLATTGALQIRQGPRLHRFARECERRRGVCSYIESLHSMLVRKYTFSARLPQDVLSTKPLLGNSISDPRDSTCLGQDAGRRYVFRQT